MKIRCHKLQYPFTPNWLVSCPHCQDAWEIASGLEAISSLAEHVTYHVNLLKILRIQLLKP